MCPLWPGHCAPGPYAVFIHIRDSLTSASGLRPRLGRQRVGLSRCIVYFEISLSKIPFHLLTEEVVKRTFSFFFRELPMPYRMAPMVVTVACFLGGPVVLCRDCHSTRGEERGLGTILGPSLGSPQSQRHTTVSSLQGSSLWPLYNNI